jgi:hypothetical protein
MEKKELKDKLKEVESLIKTNSKDSHYAETLISELKSLHGQLKHEPTLVHIPLDSVEKNIDLDTFTMSITKDGKAIYHTKGGYTLVCDSKFLQLFSLIDRCIDGFNGIDKDGIIHDENDVKSLGFLLNIPLVAPLNSDFMIEIARKTEEFMKELSLNAERELQEETPEEDKEFKGAVLAMEHIKDELNSEINEVKD